MIDSILLLLTSLWPLYIFAIIAYTIPRLLERINKF